MKPPDHVAVRRARHSEEPGAGIPHAGICDEDAGHQAFLPQSLQNMTLPHLESATVVSSMIGLLGPMLLGVIRGLFRKSGWMFLFAAISGLSTWCSLNFSILTATWSSFHQAPQDAGGIGSNGAANAFASLFGWLPGVFLFLVTLSVTFTIFRWLPNRLNQANNNG